MRHVVLIGCGSFNPVTNMHLRMFELARDALTKSGLYCVLGGIASPVASGYPKPGLLPAEHRVEMLRLALQPGNAPDSWIRLGTWESAKQEWTQTAHVLRHYKDLIDQMVDSYSLDSNDCGNGPDDKKRKIDSADEDNLGWLARQVGRVSRSSADGRRQRPEIRPMLLCGADVLQSFASPGVWKDEDMVSIVRDFGMVVISRPGSDPDKFVHSFDLINPYEKNIFMVTEWAANDISSTLIRRTLRRNESVRYMLPDLVIDYIYRHRLYGSTADWPSLEKFAD